MNPAAGDYRQAPGSATIDAGLIDPLTGAFDLDGDPRAVGTTDIGADEFVPPESAQNPPSPAPTSTAPGTDTLPAFAGVKLAGTKLAFRDRFIRLTLKCPAGAVGRCSGRIKLTRRVTLGQAPFSVAAGTQAKVTLRVTRAGRRLLVRALRSRARSIIAARDEAGRSRATVATVTIRRTRG